jgi:hypothetical protein
MRILLFLIGIFLTEAVFAQIPIGKDIEKGKSEFIAFMKTNEFTFYKETKEEVMKYNKETEKGDKPTGKFYYTILFKEEVEVKMYFNQYGNINEIYIFPEKEQNKKKILNILKLEDWEFLYDRKDMFGIDKIYKVGDFYAMIPSTQISQINFYDFKP